MRKEDGNFALRCTSPLRNPKDIQPRHKFQEEEDKLTSQDEAVKTKIKLLRGSLILPAWLLKRRVRSLQRRV